MNCLNIMEFRERRTYYPSLNIRNMEPRTNDMSMRHENVSCDSCLRSNFTGKRYKCLVCSDYDLCEGCRDTQDDHHLSSHPMQCLLTPADLTLHFPGAEDFGPSLTCPVCGALGHTELTLQAHLVSKHPDCANKELMCPACALLPIRECNMLTEDLGNHLLLEHNHRGEGLSIVGEEGPRRRPVDPLGELLSTISRRGLQRQYRPPSVYSLHRPLSASSSGLSVRRPQPNAIHLQSSGPAHKSDENKYLLDVQGKKQLPQPQLEHVDELRAIRSMFTKDVIYSSFCTPDLPETLTKDLLNVHI